MTDPVRIPVTADDVADVDFDASASPPPGSAGPRSLVQHAGPDAADPGHVMTDKEWAEVVARVESRES